MAFHQDRPLLSRENTQKTDQCDQWRGRSADLDQPICRAHNQAHEETK